jgi:hypothetical protein
MSNTKAFVFTMILIVGIYDLWAVLYGGVDASVSQLITNTIGNYPFQMFLFGMLVDHMMGFSMEKKE